jgi:aminoglycoside phosphotransferase (APT) family kinase protein
VAVADNVGGGPPATNDEGGDDVLTMSDVIPYLCKRRLLSRADVVDGEVRVFDVSRRNHDFKVLCRSGTSLFIKQGQMRDGFSSVRREAQVYALLGNSSPGTSVYPNVPRFLDYDEVEDVLVVEFLTTAIDLRRYDRQRRSPSTRAATQLGTALATLHHCSRPTDTVERLGAGEPGVLMAQRPGLALLRDFSGASIDLVRLIQGDTELNRHLETLRHEWRSDALIHHDVRWDNILVAPRTGAVTLIDWETAAVGDPAWDVGSAVGDYLSHWLLSIPASGDTPPDQVLHLARRPLATLQPAMAALWRGYCRTAELGRDQQAEFTVQVARFTGLKLVQSAIEQVQMLPTWTVSAICQLQVGANMMAQPAQGSQVLLGLDVAA